MQPPLGTLLRQLLKYKQCINSERRIHHSCTVRFAASTGSWFGHSLVSFLFFYCSFQKKTDCIRIASKPLTTGNTIDFNRTVKFLMSLISWAYQLHTAPCCRHACGKYLRSRLLEITDGFLG